MYGTDSGSTALTGELCLTSFTELAETSGAHGSTFGLHPLNILLTGFSAWFEGHKAKQMSQNS